MIRNNQNGRRRGRGGGAPRPQQGGTGGGNYGNNGSRIDNRQRGNATQLLEKYKALARDATQNGDRVQAEFYMQYADHYFRVLSEFRARDPQPAPRSTYDDDDDGYGAPGQSYAAGGDRYGDDEGDERGQGGFGNGGERQDRGQGDRSAADRGAGDRSFGGNGGERQLYRANGERPQGNYNGQPRGDRVDDRDNRQRYSRDGDDGRPDAARADGDGQRRDGNGDARREAGRSESWRGDGGRNDNGRGDGGRNDGVRRDGGRPRDWDGNRRHAGARDEALRDTAPPGNDAAALIGLPGPATLASTAPLVESPLADEGRPDAPAVDLAATDAAAPRRRGRPRKVVVDTVEG